jgi:peptidoglycan/xylan/chitin deacetylase (PgdA/CDA1 family)
MKPLIVDDDPFLTESPNGLGVYYNFEQFKKVHEMIAGAGQIHTLAICAGEIENNPELKEYILSRKDEFNLQLHGWLHERYSEWSKEAIKVSLQRAKDKIEKTFDVEVSLFFPPWNKRSPAMYEACKEIGVKLDDQWVNLTQALAGETKETIRFHSWNTLEVEQLKKYLDVHSNN